MSIENKTVYAFGDSIVYGHTAPEKSFMRLIADEYNLNLNMCAVNGASVICKDSAEKEDKNEKTMGNYIINQIISAPDEKPDIIVFNGYTNDAYGDPKTDCHNLNNAHINVMEHLGKMGEPKFDNSTFCGAFEEIIDTMQKKWQGVPIMYITTHKSGGRDWEVQCTLRDLALGICKNYGVSVCDMFSDCALDTRNGTEMQKYIMGGAGSHPNVCACREFYIPAVVKEMESILK